jgi:hypothetical protein
MTTVTARSAEIATFADALHATGSVRIRLDRLWTLWATAVPRLVGHPAQAAVLATALHDMAARGDIELPVTAWDTSTTPPLPRAVVIPATRRAPRDRAWRRFPWRRELGWVASLPTLPDARLSDLIAINDWLSRTDGTTVPVVPLRYRSVEVFGDEKCLEGILRTNLFGAGRLTLEILACVRIPPPVPAVAIGPGSDVLVVENSDTYWAAVDALSPGGTDRIGAVAWGCGKAFPSQVAALAVDVAGRGPVAGTIWYWGDLDPAGLTIATSAAAAATATGRPSVRAAEALWAEMAHRPIQDPGTIDWSAAPGRSWLGPHLWNQLTPVHDGQGRVAQESVPARAIRDWAESIP